MSTSFTDREPFETQTAAIPMCALDDAGRRQQQTRYARLAASVSRLDRTPAAVAVQFDEHLDRNLLEQALAVERECCPFFVLEFDEGRRHLRVTVREAEQRPALEAIAAALSSAQ